MPTNFNRSIFLKANELFNIRDGNFFSNELPKTITPVVDVKQNTDVVGSLSRTTTGTATAYTTPTGVDFFLTGIELGIVKNATCDAGTGSIAVTALANSQTLNLVRLPILDLTAQDSSIYISFDNPIKLDRNTSVSVTGTYTAGTMVRIVSVYGYTSDTLN